MFNKIAIILVGLALVRCGKGMDINAGFVEAKKTKQTCYDTSVTIGTDSLEVHVTKKDCSYWDINSPIFDQ